MTVTDLVIVASFKIINFGIVIGIASYFFIKKLLPQVRTQIKQEEDAQEAQLDHKRSLGRQENELAKLIRDEGDECERLKEQVLTWRLSLQQVLVKRAQQKEDQMRLIAEQQERSIASIMEHKIQQEMVPLVINDVRQTLEKELTSSQVDALNNTIITVIKKSSS